MHEHGVPLLDKCNSSAEYICECTSALTSQSQMLPTEYSLWQEAPCVAICSTPKGILRTFSLFQNELDQAYKTFEVQIINNNNLSTNNNKNNHYFSLKGHIPHFCHFKEMLITCAKFLSLISSSVLSNKEGQKDGRTKGWKDRKERKDRQTDRRKEGSYNWQHTLMMQKKHADTLCAADWSKL